MAGFRASAATVASPRLRRAAASAALLVLLGLAGAGCNMISLWQGRDPLSAEELPEWAKRELEGLPSNDALRRAADRIESNPGRWRSKRQVSWSLDSADLYDSRDREKSPPAGGGHALAWDRVPGHRFLYDHQDSDGAILPVPPIPIFVFASESREHCVFDSEPGRLVAFHRGGYFVSAPYCQYWSLRPAGLTLEDARRKIMAREMEPVPEAYRVEETHVVAFGILGWGKVNRTRYFQLLWIPIPLWSEDPPPESRTKEGSR